MSRWLMSCGVFVAAACLTSGLAFGQQPPAPCKNNQVQTPEKVEGQVVSVDQNAGKVTIQDSKGGRHEFQASRETLQEMKPGDRVEAKLREAPKC